jgi:Flp pilus assembly protein TadG
VIEEFLGMISHRTIRSAVSHFGRSKDGGSLIEVAVFLPLVLLCAAYAVEFAYFFIISATLISSSRNAAQYSIQGYQSPGQISLPAAGPSSSVSSVAALAVGDLGSNAVSGASVNVCSKVVGVTGNATQCVSYGPSVSTNTSLASQIDPEAPTFLLNRVDITYTVQPPIPLTFFNIQLVPTLAFHRYTSMRVMD